MFCFFFFFFCVIQYLTTSIPRHLYHFFLCNISARHTRYLIIFLLTSSCKQLLICFSIAPVTKAKYRKVIAVTELRCVVMRRVVNMLMTC
uniref:Uncharacterized protein n=1 Tax=Rhipicephalus microplus TaxID=6941 RepID=A0A6M2DCY3_RHIMP